ncbi:hypothetical protein BJY14_004010 [Actinomadura luteofluorescens]|uniref:Uncharacterized protein n=1 Tax=Actinomadura luteofluorescens TaxID=46163 RepID=A0A7Y9EI19_9ACTN|nr:hypothetical protein [Actinomadura luteofluorescens]NYD48027.1 hypothetical protein [Actinomadura luteofluorescens]
MAVPITDPYNSTTSAGDQRHDSAIAMLAPYSGIMQITDDPRCYLFRVFDARSADLDFLLTVAHADSNDLPAGGRPGHDTRDEGRDNTLRL